MTDQPTTQERCPTCDYPNGPWRCPDPWHGSQDVEGEGRRQPRDNEAAGVGSSVDRISPSTTQEAEKALEDEWNIVREALSGCCAECIDDEGEGDLHEPWCGYAALRSLRTQHTEMQTEIGRLKEELKDATSR